MTDSTQSIVRCAVTRTSRYDEETPPCEEATRGTLDYWDRRTFKSPEEHDAKLGEKWLDKGTEHGYWKTAGERGIKRNMGSRTAWFVEFASLEDLWAFQRKYGPLVLEGAFGNESTPAIEIYDGYRE